jgi:general L-amino acid transport system permease protein
MVPAQPLAAKYPARAWSWRAPTLTRRQRGVLLQLVAALLILAALAALIGTVSANLVRLNLTSGFDFLLRPAGFRIGESVISFEPSDSFLRAIIAGAINTLRVALAGCVLATLLGLVVGVLRLSDNPLLRTLTGIYVDACRNTPLLLQILLWSALLLHLPPIRQAIDLGGWIFLSQRGLQVPALWVDAGSIAAPFAASLAAASGLAVAGAIRALRRRGWLIGRGLGVAATILAPLVLAGAILAVGDAVHLQLPVKRPFNFEGGLRLTPEYVALLIGLVVYAGAFIAEIVRAGILAVPRGQWEAARSLGLSQGATLRLVVIPQSLRIIIPSLTIQYVGLIKGTSLAVAIGYADLFWAVSTTINITGHAIEGVAVLMAGYLTMTLGAAGLMNSLAARLARGRGVASGSVASVPSASASGTREGLLRTLFGTKLNAGITIACSALLWFLMPDFFAWAVRDAVWSGGPEACRAAAGACWQFVGEKLNTFLFALYPYAERWRPLAAMPLLLAIGAASLVPALWSRWLLPAWGAVLVLVVWLLGGGGPLPSVPADSWGGLPLTLLLAVCGLASGFPLGIVLALGRTGAVPLFRILCIGFIEIFRGVPFVSVLFMASVTLPLFVPADLTPGKVLRAYLAFAAVAACYLAEVVRGGLQAVPRGQVEAAQALGLADWRCMAMIVLPQALRVSVPPLVNVAVSFLKDTSLVMVIGLVDLLGAINAAARDTAWQGFEIEGYVFAALVYFALCASLTRYASWLERRLRRDAAPRARRAEMLAAAPS